MNPVNQNIIKRFNNIKYSRNYAILIVLRSAHREGDIKLTVTSPDLPEAEINIKSIIE